MTTIAVSNYQIACDLQFTHPNGFRYKGKTKLYEFKGNAIYPKDFIVGFCGDPGAMVKVSDWLREPKGKAPRFKASEFAVLTSDNKIFGFYQADAWDEIDLPYYAIGTGSTFALGAMSCGALPAAAVEVAMEHDPSTGYGVKFFEYK